jgi:hypothetical protein
MIVVGFGTPGDSMRDQHDVTPPALAAPCIAVYDSPGAAPLVTRIEAGSVEDLVDSLTRTTHELAAAQGGRMPQSALRQVIENLVHAGFADAVVSILDRGNTVRVADRGPGIADKERALLPGFTTADVESRRHIKGVGSGLAVAGESLAAAEGTLTIEDNLDGGTVVTLRLPIEDPGPAVPTPPERPGATTTERQLKMLLLVLEIGPSGPTGLAKELQISPSTAYRDLLTLEDLGFVASDSGGLRTLTDRGLAHVEAVL